MGQFAAHMTRRSAMAGAGVFAAGLLMAGRSAEAAAGTVTTAPEDIETWTSDNPALRGAFVPVFDERDDANLSVKGEIPPGLRGVFMRNGPNPRFKPDDHYAYPFDGTGMLHAIYLENGRVRYRNRWIKTAEFLQEQAAGHRVYNSGFSAPPHADLANTNIVRHAGRYLALFEAGKPYEVDRDLGTVGVFDYSGKLPTVMSAHPKLDPASGELLSIAYNLQTGAMIYLRADPAGQLDAIVPFQAPWGAMVHDICLTEQHVVAFIGPAVFDRSRPGPPVTWQPDRGTMVAVIPRSAKEAADIKWIRGAPFFQFHVMNGFIEADRIEVTVPWYDSFSLAKPAARLELHKIVIDTKAARVADQVLDDRACEFPRVNDRFLGRRTRYGYVGLRDPRPGEKPQTGAFEAVARYDLSTGSKAVYQFPAGVTICEPLFVADPHGKDEQDGFIFAFAHQAGVPAEAL